MSNKDKTQVYLPKCVIFHNYIIHEGRLINHGHYISYFADETGTWYRADDIVVYKVKHEQVMKLHPYVLFYKRENI